MNLDANYHYGYLPPIDDMFVERDNRRGKIHKIILIWVKQLSGRGDYDAAYPMGPAFPPGKMMLCLSSHMQSMTI